MRTLQALSWLAGVAIASVALAYPSPAGANAHLPTTLDKQLLRADAIFFATVSELRTVDGDGGLVELSLAQHNRVASRWQTLPERIRLRGSIHSRDGTRFVSPPHIYEDITEGGRYLLLLRGGAWREAPVLQVGKAVYPVRDGEVKCHAGEVYGLTARGVLCSRRIRQAGDPLGEAELAAELSRALADARRRRPALAADNDVAARPFLLDPEHAR